ncbi:UNVERIFIED_CONTAM: ATP-dependent Clp protease proteolytic subunit, chloroplastic [Sesamum latifolium]|uniref:ATP-dependent Clp protease proteolytic subunit n=1 Tax=Sesamum latifolium TaxID=2727402 RepID=A0AAW2V0H2_9LAMI
MRVAKPLFYTFFMLEEGGGLRCLHVPLVCSLQGAEAYVGSLIKDSNGVIEAKKGNPPIMPAVMTPGGPLDLSTVLFRNRIIFIGQPINSQVAQRVTSQLVTLATIDEESDILMYLNCPGGSTYSVLAIYECMSWIKPKVGTVCFGVAASQGALLLAGGEKGMRYAMPNARIMIHQPQSGCGGHVEDVRRQVNEAVQSRHVSFLLSIPNILYWLLVSWFLLKAAVHVPEKGPRVSPKYLRSNIFLLKTLSKCILYDVMLSLEFISKFCEMLMLCNKLVAFHGILDEHEIELMAVLLCLEYFTEIWMTKMQ